MKEIIILILLTFLLSVFADSTDSTKTSKPVPFKRVVEKERNYKGAAPIISVFVPGGGHFYLGNHNKGKIYAVGRLVIIPGVLLMLNNFMDGDETLFWTGTSLSFVGIGFWITDVIDAGISARKYNKIIRNHNKKLSYGIISDFDEKKYGVLLNYTFK